MWCLMMGSSIDQTGSALDLFALHHRDSSGRGFKATEQEGEKPKLMNGVGGLFLRLSVGELVKRPVNLLAEAITEQTVRSEF